MHTDASMTALAISPMTIPATLPELNPEGDTHSCCNGGPHSAGLFSRNDSSVKLEASRHGGSWPERLLYKSLSIGRPLVTTRDSGMGPSRRLPPRLRRRRPRKPVRNTGKSPEKRLAPRSRVRRRSHVSLGPVGVGIAPVRALPWRQSLARQSQRFHMEARARQKRRCRRGRAWTERSHCRARAGWRRRASWRRGRIMEGREGTELRREASGERGRGEADGG
ncbi:uncharacterized protein LOC123395432 [Hordeum vulgare subsp. vulgare]|uniref:uncharacterized protein LOC123395432 n=1 Tax=Hordeum vulgare subsp. vulgare TaxID=112509 RepID=UPI001D1A37DE|nr:uncharacterized protein LOC123395432 [Hordeum vulgare subsp. vulgare]